MSRSAGAGLAPFCLEDTFRRRRIPLEQVRRADRPDDEVAAAIGADAFQHLICACRAESAFEGADAGVRAGRRQVAVAAFAIGSQFQHARLSIEFPKSRRRAAFRQGKNGVHGRIRTCDPRIHPTSAFAAAFRRSWSGLSLRHWPWPLGAARPVSTPSGVATGLARDWHATRAKLSPTLSRSAARFPLATPNFLGILCSILLSYVDTENGCTGLRGHDQAPAWRRGQKPPQSVWWDAFALARRRSAPRRCGRSTILPSMAMTPGLPACAKASTMARAAATASVLGVKTALMMST